jgi:hypothetical protein
MVPTRSKMIESRSFEVVSERCFEALFRKLTVGTFRDGAGSVLDNGRCEPGEVPVFTCRERRLAGVRSVS